MGPAEVDAYLNSAQFAVPRGWMPACRQRPDFILSYTLVPKTIPNPSAGREHEFGAWRVTRGSRELVELRNPADVARKPDDKNGQNNCEG